MRDSSAGSSEVTSPERRGFIVVLGVMSLLFLAVESPQFAQQPTYVLAARLVMSALLLAAPVLLGRPLAPRLVQGIVYTLGAGVCLSFATIAWGTGGTLSPYFAFLPMLSLVFTIAVPDVPLGSLLAGACAGSVGLARVWVEGTRAPETLFWVLAFTSTTTYAVVGSIFNRRQRARERRLVTERARAEEILAESERQRARAERLALAGRLAAGVAHDVANPLSVVMASVGFLEQHLAPRSREDPDVASTLADVRVSLDRIQRTVEDLRRVAQTEVGAREDCDLAVIAEEARLTLHERFHASVAIARDPSAVLPRVHAVRSRLVHALVWVLVDASGRGVRRLRMAARRDGAEVILELDDDRADLSVAPLDLPAATVREADLALALAREDLLRAGCHVEEVAHGGDLHMPLRIRCAGCGDAVARDPQRRAEGV